MIKDLDFYKKTMRIAIPIMIQNGITNLVNMLDNIMVGQVGTNPMSGVAIVNQLMFIFNLCIFGGLAGIGIFTAQFSGKKDEQGVRYTFRLMILLSILLTIAGTMIFLFFGNDVISLYLHGEGTVQNVQETLYYGHQYLNVMLWGMLPFAIAQVYASVLRARNETVQPMRASIIAVIINLIGNYVLIYGKFGFPQLGVVGAAIATTVSRFIEALYLIIWTQTHKEVNEFIIGAFHSIFVPMNLVWESFKKGLPLLINEALWSTSQAVLSQNYSLRGLDVIAATNISSTISNVFYISFIAMGSATGIIMGQELGKGNFDTVKRDAHRLSIFTILLCVLTGGALLVVSNIFPGIYNTTPEIQHLSSRLIRVNAYCMPIYGYVNAAYFILRSGGKTFITFLFDSFYCWVVSIPIAFLLIHFTDFNIVTIFLCVQLADLVKCVAGFYLVEKEYWIQDLTMTFGEAK